MYMWAANNHIMKCKSSNYVCMIAELEARQEIVQCGVQLICTSVCEYMYLYIYAASLSVTLGNAIIMALHINSVLDPHDLYAALWRTRNLTADDRARRLAQRHVMEDLESKPADDCFRHLAWRHVAASLHILCMHYSISR